MFKQIIKIIWIQRQNNGWIFCELLLVLFALIWIVDILLIDRNLFNKPLGFDIENTYRLKFGVLTPVSTEFISPEISGSTVGDDLITLLDNIRRHPEVEEIALSKFAAPYIGMTSNIPLKLPEGHSSAVEERHFQYNVVSKEFFDVFRIKNLDGELLGLLLDSDQIHFVFTKELALYYFEEEVEKGRTFIISPDSEYPVKDISESYRYHEYLFPRRFLYGVFGKTHLRTFFDVSPGGENYMEITVRMKRHKSENEMYDFLKDLGDRTKVNNVSISSFQSFDKIRAQAIRKNVGAAKKNVAILAFLLINILFGVIGTFWLRTQYRQGEIGLRIALGATRYEIFSYLFLEGMALLLLTLPFVLIYVFNLVTFDIFKVGVIPFVWWRFAVTVGGSYLLVGLMICLGVWLPARKSMHVAPADALHYE